MIARSAFVLAWMFGRWILTTTCSSPLTTARCTCAVDAAARGVWSMEVEQLLGRPAQLLEDDLLCLRPGEGAGVALELGHLLAPVVRQAVGLAGDDLSELDPGRAEELQHDAHDLGYGLPRYRIRLSVHQEVDLEPQTAQEAEPA